MTDPTSLLSGPDDARPRPSTARPSWIVRALGGLIGVYQKLVSPALVALNPSCGCRFAPTCSHYAQAALREHGLVVGLALAAVRLAKCGPWHPGGDDPVPPRKIPSCIRSEPITGIARATFTLPPGRSPSAPLPSS